jgi:DNA helicase HerA-like ATPase
MSVDTEPTRATASSLDGRTFVCELPPESPVMCGDLVALVAQDGTTMCGQLLEKRFGKRRCTGTGSVVGTVGGDGTVVVERVAPFANARLSAAPAEVAASLHERSGAGMPVGTTREGPAQLLAKGFNRHTFMCGQSGSGKSYALGVLLEQILIDTDLPLIILDPNADFVRLGETLESASEPDATRLRAQTTTVLRPNPADGAEALCVRFRGLSSEAKAAVLELDPLADRDEYNALLNVSELLHDTNPGEAIQQLMNSEAPDQRMLAQRIANLGVLNWDVWAFEQTPVDQIIDRRDRATVLDLSGFEHPQERLVVAMDVLNHIWKNREDRQPRLIVIDEAHNICSAEPRTALERATTERLIQIANEGRKYGIWLLLCTQRPSRINAGVLSQCDNLALMKMNSRGDLAQLQDYFGFAPPEMLASAPHFRQGECLIAGGFSSVPSFVRIGARRTQQGGSDVAVPMSAVRS